MLNVRDPRDLIFEAARMNDGLLIRSLLAERKASVIDVEQGSDHSALHIAIIGGKMEAAEILLQHGAEPLLENGTQETPYDMAWKTVLTFGDTPNAALWQPIRRTDRWEQTCLQVSMYYNDPVTFGKLFIDRGNDVNARDIGGSCTLLEAVRMGHHDAVTMLVDRGADVTLQDQWGCSPLLAAVGANNIEMTSKLLQSPFVDTGVVDCQNRLVLHYAAANADAALLQLLTNHRSEGVDITAKSTAGHTAFDVVEQRQAEGLHESKTGIDEVWMRLFAALLEHVTQIVQGPPPPYRDVEDQATDYSRTDSRGSSVYHDAKQHLSPLSTRFARYITGSKK
ncbi:hypothetical protein CAC42_3863 [Sphaceloma murrayae]|uniref:Uncharacterized protein n=1 Tax=Sphaceloma murrayae TaxID=2082308 RepID=A0A2K1QS57_9PEZI|nr:hypothetical protein CAC42_3863 [Sphaceloma murrayae]